MDNDTIKLLTDLAQLDIDAIGAYDQALEKIDDEEIWRSIHSFRSDHLRHVDELSALIVQYGGNPPEGTRDFKGYLIEGFTSLRSITGTQGALSAMRMNEKFTNKIYQDALYDNSILPQEAQQLIRRNYDDEKRHLEYIVKALKMLEEVES